MRQLKDETKRGKKIQEKEEFMKKETVRLADGRYIIFYDFTLPDTVEEEPVFEV